MRPAASRVDVVRQRLRDGIHGVDQLPDHRGRLPDDLWRRQRCLRDELNPAAPALIYSTYLGGSSDRAGLGIAVDASGNAYVTGWSVSSDFPTTLGAFQTTYNGSFDAFWPRLVRRQHLPQLRRQHRHLHRLRLRPTPTPTPAHQYSAQVQQPINADGTSVFNDNRGVVPVNLP